MLIPEYNKIDTKNDTKEVIQAKINTMKEALNKGEISQEEYDSEKNRVEGDLYIRKLGYAFTW